MTFDLRSLCSFQNTFLPHTMSGENLHRRCTDINYKSGTSKSTQVFPLSCSNAILTKWHAPLKHLCSKEIIKIKCFIFSWLWYFVCFLLIALLLLCIFYVFEIYFYHFDFNFYFVLWFTFYAFCILFVYFSPFTFVQILRTLIFYCISYIKGFGLKLNLQDEWYKHTKYPPKDF